MKILKSLFGKKKRDEADSKRDLPQFESHVKDLYREFSKSVRSIEFFHGWRKIGNRKFEDTSDGLRKSIFLNQMTGSFGKRRHVGLAIEVAVQSNISQFPLVTTSRHQIGEIVYRWYARKGRGIGEAQVSQDRTWWIESEEELARFKLELVETLNDEVRPWASRVSAPADLLSWLESVNPSTSSWPLRLALGQYEIVQSEMCDLFRTETSSRPPDNLVDWLVANQLLSDEIGSEIKLAAIQIEDEYKLRMKTISARLQES